MRMRKPYFLLLLLLFIFLISEAEIFYPWKDVYMGALQADSWAGMVLAPHPESVFAFRLRIKKDGEIAEGQDFLSSCSGWTVRQNEDGFKPSF
jgi:hypothetical protein